MTEKNNPVNIEYDDRGDIFLSIDTDDTHSFCRLSLRELRDLERSCMAIINTAMDDLK